VLEESRVNQRRLWSFNRQLVWGQYVFLNEVPQTWVRELGIENESHFEGLLDARRALGIPCAIEYSGDERTTRRRKMEEKQYYDQINAGSEQRWLRITEACREAGIDEELLTRHPDAPEPTQADRLPVVGTLAQFTRAVREYDPTAEVHENTALHAIEVTCEPWLEIPVRFAGWSHLPMGVVLVVKLRGVEPVKVPARPFLRPRFSGIREWWDGLLTMLGVRGDGGL
jgi:hypothetical protein